MSTTSNSVPAGKENSILTVLSVSEVAEYLGVQDIERFRIGTIWRPSEQEQIALKVVRMFDRGMDYLLEQCGSAEEVGRLLFQVKAKAKEAKGLQDVQKARSISWEAKESVTDW